ncbi:MAG: hypothetical protein JO060_04655 [Candidatus Eremiobacteraeota bacterium]|nr:hypothetical protein [Candidatus Eremiobacteraeota bacterium]
MPQRFAILSLGATVTALAAALAACGGGGSGGGGGTPPMGGGSPPPPTSQVIRVAIPTSAIGTIQSAFGIIGGYTQSGTSQILGFKPGQQVEIQNAQNSGTGIPHTLGDTGGSSGFPSSPSLSLQSNTANGGKLTHGFQTGTLQPGELRGPFTLEAGTYFIGCAYHYATDNMRDVLVVAADATPGPAATPPAGETPPPNSGGGGYGP